MDKNEEDFPFTHEVRIYVNSGKMDPSKYSINPHIKHMSTLSRVTLVFCVSV